MSLVNLSHTPVRFEPYILDNGIIYRNEVILCKLKEKLPSFVNTKVWVPNMVGDIER